MSEAFLPTTGVALWGTGALLVSLVVAGGALQARGGRMVRWTLVAAALAAAQWLVADQPAGYRMLALCGAMLYGMKAVVGGESVRAGARPLGALRWFVFSVLWVGMRPAPFAALGGRPRRGVRDLALLGVRNVAIGALLLWGAHRATDGARPVLALLLGMPALSLLVHFGLFHLQAAALRRLGVDVGALFRNPPASHSLSEFWGRRWNRAFSEMTSLAVHRPLRSVIGNRAAVTVAFLASGALHELAISAPVNAGWGGPLGYFGLHALAMALEKRLQLGGWRGRAWTFAWILLPLPVLFHPPFLAGVVRPLLG